ncbi:tRNA-splicing endonuclease [Chloropicon primus]|uniref:tRNA-intron lyase n=2 Tax=Chloropicon primus TaxID=1764295 RepID=A0A5B8MHX1_9CHLO|nr:tRNA-splicing endonuclease [Chloropicon primus]UPQ99261.1 tRNA-splicing endonuclease [Chloropicon primus]|eukprot:QDZ20049.1 tRNA-splicing endonuclease [Chloropicon primus]
MGTDPTGGTRAVEKEASSSGREASFSSCGKIQVDILWGMGFVWSERDVERLKSEHNVYGSAVGAVPGQLQQNGIHGLPVQIQPEAVAYLLEKGAIEIVSVKSVEERGPGGGGAAGALVGGHDPQRVESFLARLNGRGKVRFPLAGDVAAVDATGCPGSKLAVEREKLCVYRKMKDKGYAVTDGKKFGAQYLVYETNPDDAHAFVTLKVSSLHDPIDPLHLIASARVAHSARKHLTVASVAEGQEVRFLTFSPEGGFPDPPKGVPEDEEDWDNPEAIDIDESLMGPPGEEDNGGEWEMDVDADDADPAGEAEAAARPGPKTCTEAAGDAKLSRPDDPQEAFAEIAKEIEAAKTKAKTAKGEGDRRKQREAGLAIRALKDELKGLGLWDESLFQHPGDDSIVIDLNL